MGTFFVPKTSVQTIPEKPLQREVIGPQTIYTCPTGKKAIAIFRVYCESLGAASTTALRTPDDATDYASWRSAGSGVDDPWKPGILAVGVIISVKFQLDAGEEIKFTQSSGTNAEWVVAGSVKELPA
jgi:hypothetical protein